MVYERKHAEIGKTLELARGLAGSSDAAPDAETIRSAVKSVLEKSNHDAQQESRATHRWLKSPEDILVAAATICALWCTYVFRNELKSFEDRVLGRTNKQPKKHTIIPETPAARQAAPAARATPNERASKLHAATPSNHSEATPHGHAHSAQSSQSSINTKRTHQLRRATYDFWNSLDGISFEHEFSELLGDLGYRTTVTPRSGDGGIDILAVRDGATMAVQCKRTSAPASPAMTRELLGSMTHSRVPHGMLVCTAGFSKGARDFAAQNSIQLVDVHAIVLLSQQALHRTS
jgi:hypothetical protein